MPGTMLDTLSMSMVFNEEWYWCYPPKEHLSLSDDLFVRYSQGEDAHGIQGVQAREVTQARKHRIPPRQQILA